MCAYTRHSEVIVHFHLDPIYTHKHIYSFCYFVHSTKNLISEQSTVSNENTLVFQFLALQEKLIYNCCSQNF